MGRGNLVVFLGFAGALGYYCMGGPSVSRGGRHLRAQPSSVGGREGGGRGWGARVPHYVFKALYY